MASEEPYVEEEEEDFDSREHQGCYIFTPTPADEGPESSRATKRRRTSKNKGNKEPETKRGFFGQKRNVGGEGLFQVLFNGEEKVEYVKLRWETYQRLWKEQEERTNTILASFNDKTLDDVSEFVNNATLESYDGKIPTALILAGPNIASHGLLFTQLSERIRDENRIGPVVVLTSKDAANLKVALKKLIKDATQQEGRLDDEDDDELVAGRKGVKLLNYDLQILQNWCAQHPGKKVTIAVQDTEAFDSNVLTDLISLFSAYLDRIPFILLLGLATSVEIFHDKLPKSTIRLMHGDKFDVARSEECLAQIFNDAVVGGEDCGLRLGASVCDFLLERFKDSTQSIQAFVVALKYAYMSHFYANPLSFILGFVDEPDKLGELLTDLHLESIRNLPSFRRHVENKLNSKDVSDIRKLLEEDDYLRSAVSMGMCECRDYAIRLGQGLAVLEISRSCTSSQNKTPRYELYSKALSGQLQGSPVVRELLLSVKKMNSGSLINLLDQVIQQVPNSYLVTEKFAPLMEEIGTLIEESEAKGKKSLTSEFDISNDTLRATAVSKKIRMGEQKSSLTKQDAEYSKLVKQVHDALEEFLNTNISGLQDVFLHEIFFYDMISPHRDVFAPRSRTTIERALSTPQDYLACDCCSPAIAGEETGIKSTHPPTSVLYQLYLESGALINIFDLWSAFYSVVGGEDGERVDEGTAQALFYRGVAELRWLGFVKHTKKKTDHLAKLAWKGL